MTVTYGDRFHLVRHVIRAALDCGVAQVIVVANGAAAGSAAALERLADEANGTVHMVSLPQNLGSAGGFKAGLEHAASHSGCDFIWLLDDDNVPEPGALQILLAQHGRLRREIPEDRLALASYRDTRTTARRVKRGAPPGLVFPLPSSFQKFHLFNWARNLARMILLRWRKVAGGIASPEVAAVPYAPWGGLFLHRSVLDTCGLPDERFFLYVDDTEFTNRLVRAGGRVYLVFSSVVRDIEPQWHGGVRLRALMGDSDLRAYYNTRNRAYFDAHCGAGRGAWYAINKAAYLSRLGILALLRRRWARYLLIRRAIRDGEAGRLGAVASLPHGAETRIQDAGPEPQPAGPAAQPRIEVGFLFNHYADHQVLHGAPMAFELSRLQPQLGVTLIAGCGTTARLLERIAALYPGHTCRIVTACVPAAAWLYHALVGQYSFVRKRAVLKHNRALFARLDALVVPEMNSVRLKTDLGLERLRMIHVSHGPEHRWVGRDERLRTFDLALVSGRKACDRFTASGFVAPERCRIIGYPKFDLVKALAPEPSRLFANDRPVVLYNPHFKHGESSWYEMGIAVLEYFRCHPEYNLIFAPHVVLFKRRWRHQARIPRRYRHCPNILIDTGSQASIDMSYTRAADIYLGDASSQVYEFWQRPRPSIFLNAHAVPWQDAPDLQHWHGGEVIDEVAQLGAALSRAGELHRSRYRAEQERLFANAFDLTAVPSALRAAQAITDYLTAVPDEAPGVHPQSPARAGGTPDRTPREDAPHPAPDAIEHA